MLLVPSECKVLPGCKPGEWYTTLQPVWEPHNTKAGTEWYMATRLPHNTKGGTEWYMATRLPHNTKGGTEWCMATRLPHNTKGGTEWYMVEGAVAASSKLGVGEGEAP